LTATRAGGGGLVGRRGDDDDDQSRVVEDVNHRSPTPGRRSGERRSRGDVPPPTPAIDRQPGRPAGLWRERGEIGAPAASRPVQKVQLLLRWAGRRAIDVPTPTPAVVHSCSSRSGVRPSSYRRVARGTTTRGGRTTTYTSWKRARTRWR